MKLVELVKESLPNPRDFEYSEFEEYSNISKNEEVEAKDILQAYQFMKEDKDMLQERSFEKEGRGLNYANIALLAFVGIAIFKSLR